MLDGVCLSEPCALDCFRARPLLLIACGAPVAVPVAPIDHDGDAIVGDAAQCPSEAEDRDGFQDDDGCPEPDNDEDRILDAIDACPDEPEDRDGFQDEDGCPDVDNDGDRILDVDDSCPCRAETYNGTDDEDGCPDCGLVLLVDDRIVIREKLSFAADSSDIAPAGLPIIDAVAQVLLQFDTVHLVAVQGHAARGERRPSQIGDERAARVVAELVARGVAPERLVAEGFGREHPIAAGRSSEARETNRRVEFDVREWDRPPIRHAHCSGQPIAGCGP